MSSELQRHAEQEYQNGVRMNRWRRRWLEHGRIPDMIAWMKQIDGGIDWKARDEHGRLRMGPDGYLPRKPKED